MPKNISTNIARIDLHLLLGVTLLLRAFFEMEKLSILKKNLHIFKRIHMLVNLFFYHILKFKLQAHKQIHRKEEHWDDIFFNN